MIQQIKDLIKKYPKQDLFMWTGRYSLRLYNKYNDFIDLRNGYYEGMKIKDILFDPLLKEAIEHYKKYNLKWEKYIKSADLVANEDGTFGIMIYMNDKFYEEMPKVEANDIKRIIKEALQVSI